MRRIGTLVCAVTLLGFLAGLGSAQAAAHKKLVEGTVYDTTCASGCEAECPPPPDCGPIAAESRTAVVCAKSRRERWVVVCPLSESGRFVCVQAEGCPGTNYPVYSGEGAVVKVRRRGSATLLATVPVVEGRFQVRLAPGQYVVRPFPPEPTCWSGVKIGVSVAAKHEGPVPASLEVSDGCVAHPDSE